MDSNPFWDFINEAYRQGPNGPAGPSGQRGHRSRPGDQLNWQDFFANGFPFAPMPHRSRPSPDPASAAQGAASQANDTNGQADANPARPSTPPTPPEELPEYPGEEQPRRSRTLSPPPHPLTNEDITPHGHGHCGYHGRRRHSRGRGGRHQAPFEGAPPPLFGWGRCGRRGRRGGPPFPVQEFVNQIPYIASQIPHYANQIPGLVNQFWPPPPHAHGTAPAGPSGGARGARGDPLSGDGSFVVAADVFSTPDAYIIHASVPGAKKSDIDVSFDAAKNSVSISGVIQRPAEVDEVVLSSMIEGDREVGLFERTIYLDAGAKVDAEGLAAKLEDGVLRIELPKEKEDEWTEIKKVSVE